MKLWTLASLSALAVLCMAPNDCEGNPVVAASTDSDAAAAGDAGTQRQIYSTADCQKRAACAASNGTQFSETACRNDNIVSGENADSVTCTDEYDTFLQCAANLTYDCTQPVDVQINATCGSYLTTLQTCLLQ